MDSKIQFFIENYNRKIKKYDPGKQELIDLSVEELENLLKEMPKNTPITDLPPRICTDESHIKRIEDPDFPESDKKLCKVTYIATKKAFLIPFEKTYELQKLKVRKFDWFDLNILQKIRAMIQVPSIFFYPAFNLYAYIFILIGYLTSLNTFFLILWSWLTLLIIYDIFSNILELIREIINRFESNIPLLYNTPIIEEFKPYNLSHLFIRMTISYGAFIFLYSALVIPELRLQFETLSVLGTFILTLTLPSLVLITSYSILEAYREKKKKKKRFIQELNKYIQEESLGWDSKQFYIKLLIEVKNQPLTCLGFFSKFLMILTLFLTSIPPIIDLYL